MFKSISIANLINQPKKQVDFLVDRFEEMVEPENIEYPHKHNFYSIMWVTKGKSKQNIDFKNYLISENTLFFISPGQLHLFEEWENVEGYVILFTEQFFLQIFQNKNILFEPSYLDNLHKNPFLQLKQTDTKTLQPIVDLLYDECKNVEQSTETIQALILVLLRRIQKLYSKQNNQNSNNHQVVVFKQFKKLVEIDFTKNLSITQYASLLNISTNQLNTIVKTISGQTTSDMIKLRVILEAQQLLNFSDLSVSQIADHLGFEDSSYFARYFKNKIGVSPQEFRKSHS